MNKTQKIIVTGFSKAGYEEYGKRMIESYLKYKPPFPLIIYTQDVEPLNIPGIEQRDQMAIPGLKEFIDSCDPNGVEAGKKPNEAWLEKEHKKGYSFRFDTYKFCRMVYTMWDGGRQLEDGLMLWLDGDSVLRRPLPADFFERFLPPEAAYAYLGRAPYPRYSETGFVIFRLPDAMPILQKWRDFYATGEVYNYPEWHSAFMFDRARELFPEIRGHNLTPGERKGHVIHQCEAGKYIDHLKGGVEKGRKTGGRSPEAQPQWLKTLKAHLKKAGPLYSLLRSLKQRIS